MEDYPQPDTLWDIRDDVDRIGLLVEHLVRLFAEEDFDLEAINQTISEIMSLFRFTGSFNKQILEDLLQTGDPSQGSILIGDVNSLQAQVRETAAARRTAYIEAQLKDSSEFPILASLLAERSATRVERILDKPE